MDCMKIGECIAQLRKEKGMTQQSLADALNVSNKTISKWECGLGCPDVSLWFGLSAVLGADIQKMLEGELAPNKPDNGDIEKIHFYVCPECGNILVSTGKASISCCGRRIVQLPVSQQPKPKLQVRQMDIDYYITVRHEMSKDHYIAFIAYVTGDRVLLNRLYPEQDAAVHFPMMRAAGNLYVYCVQDGLLQYPHPF